MTPPSTPALSPASGAADGDGVKAIPIPAAAGVGLRFAHHRLVREQRPAAAWFEVHAENYFADAAALDALSDIRDDYPLSLHAVGLSLGSADGIDATHLQRLVQLERQLAPGLVSDHLSWSRVGGVQLPDLLPLPYTEDTLTVIAANVERVQQALGRQLLVENPSSYLQFAHNTLGEAEFLAALVQRSGCGVLLDVNNIEVSARNRGGNPGAELDAYLYELPADAIGEIHLAGHAVKALDDGSLLRIDDHGSRVSAAVWQLYERALAVLGPRPTLIEWDTRIPAFEVLADEAARAQRRLDRLAISAPQACDAHTV